VSIEFDLVGLVAAEGALRNVLRQLLLSRLGIFDLDILKWVPFPVEINVCSGAEHIVRAFSGRNTDQFDASFQGCLDTWFKVGF